MPSKNPGMNKTISDFVKSILVIPETNCWEWKKALVKGYGHWSFRGKIRKTHHISQFLFRDIPFETFNSKIQTDHLCRNKKCCNPDHLEVVTAKENMWRIPGGRATATHCERGHAFSKENTGVNGLKARKRYCRACMNMKQRERRAAGVK